MREQRARVLAAQEAGRIGTFEAIIATGEFRCSDEMCRIFGLPEAAEYPASTFEKLIVPDDRSRSSNARTRGDGSASIFTEYRIRRANDGALRWLTRRGDYIRDEAGRIVTFTGTVHDITDRKLAELRQAGMIRLGDEVRDAGSVDGIVRSATRILGETLDLSRAGYARIDVAANVLVADVDWTAAGSPSGRGSHSLTGVAETIAELKRGLPLVVRDSAATEWLSLDLPDYAEYRIRAHVSIPFLAGGKLVGTLYAHSDVPRDWTVDEITFVRAVADRAYSAIARLESEERQRSLNAELSHRMKNTLSLVQAIATRTLRDVVDKTALDGFQDRIIALSKAHDVLLQQDWRSGRIRELVDAVLALHVEGMRLEASGPNILIGSRAVLSLSMLLHELATNAVKHGSLSSESGRVAINWKVDSASAHASLVLTWDETGGPPAVQPVKLGLGSRLIKAGLAGTGGSLVRYDSTGFKAEFRATLA